ncbi:hypothetical protein FRZ67_06725 [Panacibacter ginsenosidivorans]|uniref:DUF4890 domain-containing protein n=1 Tax=Panacibacter ginsenosidivorans TaxID=1813871 RepID=A0A5B8V6S7_9BACT|nr:hypothetical protein [Panacibacter ginsenosidivorans]QEC67002.1 hypothetical protein FRZ67_06725 [Panacibacter ginsenosidivorans]
MKKIMLLISCILIIAITSNAQDSTAKKTKKEKVQNHVQNMDSTQKQNLKDRGITKENLKDLDLSEDQKKQADNILTDTKKSKEKIKNDASLSDSQKEEKLKEIDKDAKNKINAMLTPEQKQKIKKKKEKSKTGGQ